MNKSFRLSIAAALTALSFCASVNAEESLPERAVEALGTVIASQGNAALLEIRRELKDTLLQQLKPFLPPPAAAPARPVETASRD